MLDRVMTVEFPNRGEVANFLSGNNVQVIGITAHNRLENNQMTEVHTVYYRTFMPQ